MQSDLGSSQYTPMLATALVVAEPGSPFVLDCIEVEDNIRDNEVLVQMKATGVCHTDLKLSREKSMSDIFPAVFGHEGAGIVVKIGAKVCKVQQGDRVVVTYTSCSNCKQCQRKNTSFCSTFGRENFSMSRADGSTAYSKEGKAVASHFFGQSTFSSMSVVMESCLVKLPDKAMPFELAAPLGCGIMTGAGSILNLTTFDSSSTIVIAGCGAVGFAALMAIKLSPHKPSRVICLDIVSDRLEMAKKYGATHVINPKKCGSVTAALATIAGASNCIDVAVDTTGRSDVVNELLKCAAPKGTIITVGIETTTAEVSTSIFETVNTGRTYVGCSMGNCFPQDFIPMLIEKWKDGKFPFTDLIKTYNVRDMETAAHDIHSGKVVKAVLVWD